MAVLFTTTAYSADLNIATLDPQAALFSTNVAKKELEELENSEEWKEVVEELQAKATEAREIQEKTQKDADNWISTNGRIIEFWFMER